MSRFLLDTHVVVWLAVDPSRLSQTARAHLSAAEELHVSAASAFELAQKCRVGKLPQASAILARWDELVQAMGAHELSLTAQDMASAGSITWDHRDPFDRMLVAQALLRGLTLITRGTAIRQFDGVVCADWV